MTALHRVAVALVLAVGFAVIGYMSSVAWEHARETRKDSAAGLDYAMEWRLWSEFAAQPVPDLPQAIEPDFPDLLAAAYGYRTPRSIGVTEAAARRPLPGGQLRDYRLTVQPSGIALRALHAVHRNPAPAVAIVMHGYQSTADKVMGEDTPDYMDEVGATLYMAGADVLAMDMPSDPALDAAMNLKLMSLGMTVDGLWARAACEAIEALELRQRHTAAILYAVRRAARIGEIVAVLCPPIGQAIIEPAALDRRQAVLHDLTRRNLMQPMVLATLVPLRRRDSFANFAGHARSRIAYIHTEAAWAGIADAALRSFRRTDYETARIGVILRKFDTRVANKERLVRLLHGAPIANETVGLEPR